MIRITLPLWWAQTAPVISHVVKIEAEGLTAATVGDSSALVVGEQVGCGQPLGQLGGTVTDGIVSALNRSVSSRIPGAVNTMSLVQMSASVSPRQLRRRCSIWQAS